jgi:hypothetical protein
MDLETYIESKLAEKERHYPEGMTAREKEVYREMLRKEDRFWTYFDRDHVPGKDDGEPPKGAEW